MDRTTLKWGLLALCCGLFSAQAAESDPLAASLAELGLKPKAVADSAIPGMLQVITDNGLFFASKDGRYLLQGDAYDLKDKMHLNEQILRPYRKESLAALATSGILFKSPQEKYLVTVFTDTDCGYCRKLHSDMQQYLDAGISIRYMAFPRGGEKSETFATLRSIWCAKDQQAAMNKAKAGEDVAPAQCKNNVAEQYQLGRSFGISGTPALVLADGTLIPGYQPAEALAKALAEQAKVLAETAKAG